MMSIIKFVSGAAICCFAAYLLYCVLTSGLPAKEDLNYVTGVPVNVEVATVPGRRGYSVDIIKFTVEDYRLDYSSKQENYQELYNAVLVGKEITVGVAPRPILFGLFGNNQISKTGHVTIGATEVVSYEDAVESEGLGFLVWVVISGILFLAGAFTSFSAVSRNAG